MSGLGWDEGSCPARAGMRNVEAGLGRGEGGSERIREAWGREGGVKVELKPRAGRTEGSGEFGAFSPYRGESGRGRPFPDPFWDAKALKNPPPTPGLNSSLKNTPQIQKCNLEREAGF